jgi:hypothetical protein
MLVIPANAGIQVLAIDSIANPHLDDDPGAIITFPDEAFGLDSGIRRKEEYQLYQWTFVVDFQVFRNNGLY